MTSALEGKSKQALAQFGNLSQHLTLNKQNDEALPTELLIYVTYYNHAELLRRQNKGDSVRQI